MTTSACRPPLETADVSCVTLSGVCPHRLLSAIKSFVLTLGGLQVDALLQMLLRLCQATGVVPVKSARSTTDRQVTLLEYADSRLQRVFASEIGAQQR